MKLKIGEIIPRRNVFFFSISVSGILIFIFLAIIPFQRTLAQSDAKIQELKQRIAEQRNFSGLYQSLAKSTQQKCNLALPAPKREKVSKSETGKIPSQIRAIARKSHMGVESIVPDVKTQPPDSRYLPVDVAVKGKLSNFRTFLTGLGALPYLEHIEEIQIKRIPESKEFKVRIWLALGP